MIFDDFRNILGQEPVDSEILYQEIINQRTEKSWAALWRDIAQPWRAGPVWAVKVMFHYTPYLSQFIAGRRLTKTPPVRAFEPALFTDFMNEFSDVAWVHVRRRDVFAQAVSMYMAEATDIWEDRTGTGAPPSMLRPAYDRQKLLTYAEDLIAERQQWPALFAHFRINPVTIDYEDAAAGYPDYLLPLIRHLGLSNPTAVPARRLFKLGDALNESFARQLQADHESASGGTNFSFF